MFALRFVSSLILIVWLGGAITIGGLVAPSAFAMLPPADAGSLVGETLRRFHVVAYGAGALLLLSLAVAALLGPRPRAFWARLSVAGMMLGATLVSGLFVAPRVAALRWEVGAPVSSLPPTDARRLAFGRWHQLSTALMVLTAMGGLALVYWDARDAH
jgi:hypothetical protein